MTKGQSTPCARGRYRSPTRYLQPLGLATLSAAVPAQKPTTTVSVLLAPMSRSPDHPISTVPNQLLCCLRLPTPSGSAASPYVCRSTPEPKEQEFPHEENKHFPRAGTGCGNDAVPARAGHNIEFVDIAELAKHHNIERLSKRCVERQRSDATAAVEVRPGPSLFQRAGFSYAPYRHANRHGGIESGQETRQGNGEVDQRRKARKRTVDH